jgi:hypothetical protein
MPNFEIWRGHLTVAMPGQAANSLTVRHAGLGLCIHCTIMNFLLLLINEYLNYGSQQCVTRMVFSDASSHHKVRLYPRTEVVPLGPSTQTSFVGPEKDTRVAGHVEIVVSLSTLGRIAPLGPVQAVRGKSDCKLKEGGLGQGHTNI